MKKCIDCDYFENCPKSGNICENYKKTIHRKYTKLEKAENGIFEVKFLDEEKNNGN